MLTFAVSLETSVAVASDICNGRFRQVWWSLQTSMVVASQKRLPLQTGAMIASNEYVGRFRQVSRSLAQVCWSLCTNVKVAFTKLWWTLPTSLVDASYNCGAQPLETSMPGASSFAHGDGRFTKVCLVVALHKCEGRFTNAW